MMAEIPKRSVERASRIEWLRQNTVLWQEIDPLNFKASKEAIKRVALALHREGLYSSKTLLADIEMGVFKLIRKLKGKQH